MERIVALQREGSRWLQVPSKSDADADAEAAALTTLEGDCGSRLDDDIHFINLDYPAFIAVHDTYTTKPITARTKSW